MRAKRWIQGCRSAARGNASVGAACATRLFPRKPEGRVGSNAARREQWRWKTPSVSRHRKLSTSRGRTSAEFAAGQAGRDELRRPPHSVPPWFRFPFCGTGGNGFRDRRRAPVAGSHSRPLAFIRGWIPAPTAPRIPPNPRIRTAVAIVPHLSPALNIKAHRGAEGNSGKKGFRECPQPMADTQTESTEGAEAGQRVTTGA